MRYKTIVSNKLDQIKNLANIISRGLELRNITPEEIHKISQQIDQTIDEAINLVDKETEGYN